jgi:ankyrin repeat protein
MAFLLDHEANIDHPVTCYMGTVLHRAVGSEDLEHVRFPLRRGADRYIKGVTGFTPLEVADGLRLHGIADILRNE